MRELKFLDTETTGLDSDSDSLVELTYAGLDDEPETLYFGVEEVPEFIDNLIKFTERGIAGKKYDADQLQRFIDATSGQTMVAANPSFDAAFLKASGLFHFHYRMLDIEAYAMAKLGLDQVPSTKDVYDMLNERGYEITLPEHTSRSDVLAIRDAFKILERM